MTNTITESVEVDGGSNAAYDEELLRTLRDRAKRTAIRAGLVDVEAEDVAQNALLALIQCDKDVRSPTAWVVTVALRGAQSLIRRRGVRSRLSHRVEAEHHTWRSVEKSLDLLPDLAKILRGLGQLERDVFLSRELDLCTMDELSVRTGVSTSTLKRRLERARRRIRKRYDA